MFSMGTAADPVDGVIHFRTLGWAKKQEDRG